jgi:TetR/AcrR family transcriptional regulator, cholesterol catabolism regulator
MARTTKKEAILDAALTLFAEKGVDATTTREIAERAGTAEGNLYRHFEGKDDLARTLFETTARGFANVLEAEAGDEDDPRARLDALIRGIFTFGESHLAAFAFLLASHPSHIPKDRDLLRGPYPMRLFVETIVRGVSEGAFRPVDPVLATGWIVAMAQRAVLLARMGFLADDRDKVIRETVEATRRLLASDPAEPAGEGPEDGG